MEFEVPLRYQSGVVLHVVLAVFALLSLGLLLWQFLVALRFPLHRRQVDPGFAPGVTLLKPLKGCDAETTSCLRSWFEQRYAGPVQILLGVASPDDPVCGVARELLAQFPGVDAELVLCSQSLGSNAKVSSLAQLEGRARHDVIVISDADVRVPPDLLANAVAPLRDPAVGLVNCFYRLGNPANPAMRLEAIAVNADFWSQVLQSRSLQPMDFALGAVMTTTRRHLAAIGGFASLLEFLADDYQLGHQIARTGARLELSTVVVECRSAPLPWREVWAHQVRWARTVRVCQPVPYFFSVLHNPTFWPLLWLALRPSLLSGAVFAAGVVLRLWITRQTLRRLTPEASASFFWLAPIKDLFQLLLWALAFGGRHVLWRGQRLRVVRGGRLERESGL